MGKYNMRALMIRANMFYRAGNSRSEALKKAWNLEKFIAEPSLDPYSLGLSFKEQLDCEYIRRQRKACPVVVHHEPSKLYNDLTIPASAYYTNSRGLLNAHYVGD